MFWTPWKPLNPEHAAPVDAASAPVDMVAGLKDLVQRLEDDDAMSLDIARQLQGAARNSPHAAAVDELVHLIEDLEYAQASAGARALLRELLDARERGVTPELPKILVVDDEKTNRELLTEVLKDNYKVILAKSGEMALALAERHQPDIVLLDVVMPEMDGYQVLHSLKTRDETRHIPVIFISGLDSAEDEEKGLLLGRRRLHHQALQRSHRAGARPQSRPGRFRSPVAGTPGAGRSIDRDSQPQAS